MLHVYILQSVFKVFSSNYIIVIFNFVDTPRNFIIAKLSIRKPGSSSVLIKSDSDFISTDEDPGLRIESFAIIKLRGVSTKLNIIFFHHANFQEINYIIVVTYLMLQFLLACCSILGSILNLLDLTTY